MRDGALPLSHYYKQNDNNNNLFIGNDDTLIEVMQQYDSESVYFLCKPIKFGL